MLSRFASFTDYEISAISSWIGVCYSEGIGEQAYELERELLVSMDARGMEMPYWADELT